jgi:UDP-glucose 4-epimerase
VRVLVTGAGGYLGRVVLDELLLAGHEPVALVHRSIPDTAEVTCRSGDVLDPVSLREATATVDAVMHLAALTGVRGTFDRPVRTYRLNVGGTLNLLDALASRSRPTRLILASTTGVYGATTSRCLREDTVPNPGNPYAASKLAAEHAVRWLADTGAIGGIALRIGNAAGAVGDHRDTNDTRIIPRVCAVAAGRLPHVEVYGDGHAVRDFVHVADIGRAFVSALDACEPGHFAAVNIGATAASVAEIIAMALEITGRKIPLVHRPPHGSEVRELRADLTLARTLLDWTPRRSGLDQLVGDQWGAERRR